MQPKLRVGLETKEREYYADLADAAGRTTSSNYQIGAGEMNRVFRAAVRHNNEVMGDLGWTGRD